MRRLLSLLAALALCAPPAHAKSGTGAYAPPSGGVLAAAAAKPLADLSDDAVRFSSTPALGGRAWIVQLHRTRAGAAGEALFFRGHPQIGWKTAGRLQLAMSEADYAELTAAIDDALLERGKPKAAGDDILVCTDGPGYVSERRRQGASLWLDGFCGPHPNNDVAALLKDAIVRFGPLPPGLGADPGEDRASRR